MFITQLVIAKIRMWSKSSKKYKFNSSVSVIGLKNAAIITDTVLIIAVKAQPPKHWILLSPNLPARIAAMIGAIKYPNQKRKVSRTKVPKKGCTIVTLKIKNGALTIEPNK